MPEDAPQDNLCPQCSRPLPSSRPRGLCPACLLKRGLETNTVGFTDDAQAEAARRWTPPTVEQLAPLFPELDILELIGRGGMGAVYKAREKQLDRLVALKILPPEIGREDSLAKSFAKRFAHEAQAMAKLSHPNIVTIHSFGQRSAGELAAGGSTDITASGDLYFFIMEYVDGLSLRQLLDAGTVNPKEALAIVPQICDALQYAHDRGIVHRDIKPENILLNRAGQVKIADFGLAKLVGLNAPVVDSSDGAGTATPVSADVTQAGERVMGTPQYMAPEQIDHPREVDHRADIYSLGVVFYQMLTGELPKGRYGKAFEPPSRKVVIDVRLDEVVLRALEREPSLRYQQVREVKTQVETIVGTQVSADSSRSPSPDVRIIRVEPWQRAVAVVARRNGKAVVNWRAVRNDSLVAVGVLFLWLALACSNNPHPLRVLPVVLVLWLAAFVSIVTIAIYIGLKRMPIESLIPLDSVPAKPTPAAKGQDAHIASSPDNENIQRRRFKSAAYLVMVAACDGRRVIHWPGVVLASVITAALISAGAFLFDLILYRLAGVSIMGWPFVAIAVWGAIIVVGTGIRQAYKLPIKRLTPLDSRPTPIDTTPQMGSARRAVKAPAIGLMVAAGISFAVILAIGALFLIQWLQAMQHNSDLHGSVSIVEPASVTAIFSVMVFGQFANFLILLGAVRMMQLRNRGLAIASAILAIVAAAMSMMIATPANLIGLPFGIWALVVLGRREVIAAFEATRAGQPAARRASLVPALWAIIIHAVDFGAILAVLVFVVPKFEAIFSNRGIALPTLTRAIIAASHIACEWSFVVFPMFLLLDAGVCLPLQYFAGPRARRWWSVILALMAAVVITTLGLGVGLPYARMTQAMVHSPGTPHPAKPQVPFGPAVELVINDLDEGKGNEGLILAMGQVVSLPPEFGRMSNQQRSKWIENQGIDLFVEYASNRWGFMSCGPQLNILNAGFEDVSPASIGEALVADSQLEVLKRDGWTFYLLPKESKAPLTFALRTPAGGMGVLQIVGFTDNPNGARIRYKLLQAAPSVPHVLKTNPANFANDVDPSLDKITVTFDRPMMDKSWSFTAGDKAFSEKTGSIFPQRTGEISYDAARTICTMPVKLQPGKVYWIGVNGPQHRNFKSPDGTPARPYQILFATRSADGKPTPLPEELVKQATQINAAAQPADEWKVTLPSGVTVEMIGVSENPSDGKPWWRPDGSSLSQRPYSHLGASVTPGAGERGNELAIRLTNLPKEDVGTKWAFVPPTSYAGGGPVVEKGDAIPQLLAIAAITRTSQDAITVKLGVAAGAWTTLAEASGSGSSSSGRGNVAVLFSPAHEEDNIVVVSVAHNVEDRDVRVIAVDIGGKELKPIRSITGGAGNVHQLTCTFDKVRLSNVKEFRFQDRPYEWATFRNVSLLPRHIMRAESMEYHQPTQPAEAPNVARARQTAAHTDISILSTALAAFEVDTGRYPTTTEGLAALVQKPPSSPGWKGPYFKLPAGRKSLEDPWGRPYVYRCPGQHNQNGFDLLSLGPDGQEGTDDDVTNWVEPVSQPATRPVASSAKGKDSVVIRELALSVLRAIKEDDWATLKSLSAGSQQGWLDVDWMTPMSQGKLKLVGEPPVGWSESNLKSVTAEIRKEVLLRNPDAATKVLQTLVQGDWAATLSPVTSSQYLVMVFVKTDGGWRFATLDQSKGNLADDLAKHMANIPKNLKVLRQLDHSSASQPAPSTSSGPAAGSNRGAPMSQPSTSPATGPATQPAS